MRFSLLLLSGVLFLLLLPGPVAAEVLHGEVHWQGERQIREAVVVAKGATLIIAPGSRLTFTGGSLIVEGTLRAVEASFSGENWPGLVLRHSSDSSLRGCQLRGAQIAVQVIGGAPLLSGLLLESNQIGIELRRQSRAQVQQCRFRENSKVGLFIKDGSPAAVSGNQFAGPGRFGIYVYRASPRELRGNQFAGLETGLLITFSGSRPQVLENLFVDNQTGIAVDRAASPELLRNRLRSNRLGVQLRRRVDARLQGNLLADNQLGILVSYSSYPQIVGNDFINNRLALRLEHQSSTWDLANGATSRQKQQLARGAFAKRAQPLDDSLPMGAGQSDGWVEARGNWWGEAAAEQLASEAGEWNPQFIHDGRDQPSFRDAGQDYPLDRVRFYPAAAAPQFLESE